MEQISSDGSRKKRRKIWACNACRRRKLQCDREQPACGRCRKGGQTSTCRYEDAMPRDRTAIRMHHEHVDDTGSVSTQPQKSSILADSMDDSGLVMAVAQLEHELRLVKAKRGIQNLPLPGDSEASYTAQHHVHDTMAAVRFVTEDVQSLGAVHTAQVEASPSTSYRETFTGTLAHRIPGLGEFTKEAFVQFPVLDHIRQEDSRLQHALVHPTISAPDSSRARLVALLPPKDDTDRYVSWYMEGMHRVYPILQRSAFEEDYSRLWLDLAAADPRRILIVLLVVVTAQCSAPLSAISDTTKNKRREAIAIIAAAEHWSRVVSRSFDSLLDFQISLMIPLARQLTGSWYKRTWVTAGSVVRLFMCHGLQRKINSLPSTLSTEMSQRFWTAATEFELQASFEHGMLAEAWPQQSDRPLPDFIPSNDTNSSRSSTLGDDPSETAWSFLSFSAPSLRFRHHLNAVLNDVTRTISVAQVTIYSDSIRRYLRCLPYGTGCGDQVTSALLKICLLQYLLALHVRNLHYSTSETERSSSRYAILESGSEMLRHHKVAVDCGSSIAEMLYGNHTRIALSVCFASTSTIAMRSEWLSTDTMVQSCLAVIIEVNKLAGDKIKHFGGSRQHFWLGVAAAGLLKFGFSRSDRSASLHTAKEEFMAVYGILLPNRKTSTVPARNIDANTVRADGDTVLVAQVEGLEPDISEWFNQWCNDELSWPSTDLY